jgi:hypothetical protein
MCLLARLEETFEESSGVAPADEPYLAGNATV